MEPAIRIEGVWKEYLLGGAERHGTFYEALSQTLRAPLRRFRELAGSDRERERFWALRDLSLDVAEGEVLGVIGRNGAGKSTLLKILARITAPTRGRVRLRGRVASLLEVGTGFHPELTGRENIYLNGAILGMTRREIARRFDEIVAFAEIERFLDTPVKRYSSGMYVRLAFAVAAYLDPEVLIVDEVLAVGDMQFQQKCLGRLETVSRSGRTVLFVSHNLSAVEYLCSRALLLDGGQLIKTGPASEVIDRYTGLFRERAHASGYDHLPRALRQGPFVVNTVSLTDDCGQPLRSITTDDPFLVRIEHEILQPDASAGFTLMLSDARNDIVFSSISNGDPHWYGRPMPLGRYRTTCRLPGHFLNAGWFRLSVNAFGKGFSDLRTAHDVLTFEVLDGPGVRRDYHGEYAGRLRPQLDWETVADE